jgi:hypothetical protein
MYWIDEVLVMDFGQAVVNSVKNLVLVEEARGLLTSWATVSRYLLHTTDYYH